MLAEPSAGLGVDAGDERRILEGTTPMWCYKFPSLWSGPVTGAGAASHSFVDHRHDGVRPRSNGLNQEDRPRLRRATAFAELASNRVRRSRGLGRSETADLVVSEPVEDEREELSGHRNPGLVAPPALGDPVVVGAELLVALGPVVADRLDGPPAHQSGSLLGDGSPVDALVGLTVLGGEPGPRAELLGALEAGDVADLAHEDGGQDLADAWELQEGPVAWVVLQLFVHIAVEHGDLTVVELQEVPEGLDPDRVGHREIQAVQLGIPARAPHLAHHRQDPVLGHDPVDLGLGTGAVPDQGEPVADQLSELPRLGRGDPTLGQTAQAEHGGAVLG